MHLPVAKDNPHVDDWTYWDSWPKHKRLSPLFLQQDSSFPRLIHFPWILNLFKCCPAFWFGDDIPSHLRAETDLETEDWSCHHKVRNNSNKIILRKCLQLHMVPIPSDQPSSFHFHRPESLLEAIMSSDAVSWIRNFSFHHLRRGKASSHKYWLITHSPLPTDRVIFLYSLRPASSSKRSSVIFLQWQWFEPSCVFLQMPSHGSITLKYLLELSDQYNYNFWCWWWRESVQKQLKHNSLIPSKFVEI